MVLVSFCLQKKSQNIPHTAGPTITYTQRVDRSVYMCGCDDGRVGFLLRNILRNEIESFLR